METVDLALMAKMKSDPMPDLYKNNIPSKTSDKILHYRKIQNWENYFLASGICSVAKSMGSDIDDFHFFSAITGDMFTYLYAKDKPSDSGMTNYFFVPELVKKAYNAFGYNGVYLSNEQIRKEFRFTMNAIKVSINKGVPVLAWGMGNVTTGDGSRYATLPEACLIGGYDIDDLLYVNLYLGPERTTVDNDGYTAITGGLTAAKGLFFIGERTEKPNLEKIYRESINAIPGFLSLPPADGYVFGGAAFDLWADTLLIDNNFADRSDEELSGVCWDLHCSPYCCVCTSNAYNFIKFACEQYPQINCARKILPLYEQMNQCKDGIGELQGGFFPPMNQFRTRHFREQIANILRKMGGRCEKIISSFV